MNIFGEGFPKEIIDQIEIRQKAYSYGYGKNNFNRFEGSYVYTNAKTAWCKLVSSANIDNINLINNSIIRDLGFTNGDQIARDFILFNGTTPSSSLDGKFGLGYGDTKGFGAYNSWGIQNADFGFRPMAGITSVTVKHKNRGSIRAASVNIKAWDKATFEIIDILYLRLGFSVLLEWGNSVYLENRDAVLQQNVNNSLANEFLKADLTYNEFLAKIKKQQLKSFGNYDAMFGKVTNFHWSFNQDGSYDIVLDLISAGDVLESFKVKGNALAVSDTSTTTSGTETDKPVDLETRDIYKVLAKYAPTNDIANYLYKASLVFQADHQGHASGTNYLYNYSFKTDPNTYWTPTTGDFDKAKNSSSRKKDICFVVSTTVTSSSDNSTKYNAETNYFIRLGNLLKFIQEGTMYKVKNQKGKEQPLLLFDYDFDNFMHVPPQMMSYDPSVCMVRRKVTFPGPPGSANIVDESEYFQYSGYIDQASEVRADFAEEFMVGSLDEVGKIMNIYVNFRYILTKLQESTNADTNELKLIDFLKSILSGINGAFGGYSKLELFIDESTNEVKIIDQNPLPSNKKAIEYINPTYKNSNLPEIPTNYALFELYGYTKRDNVDYEKTTIVQDFKFNTELTPEFSTMISVSATSRGNVVGENNTALSKLNLGLTDKYKTEINGGGALLDSSAQDIKTKLKEDKEKAEEEYCNFVRNLVDYLRHLFYGTYIPQEIQDNKGAFSIYSNLYKKVQKTINDYNSYDASTNSFKNLTKFQPGTGFIPFNLSLTIDGLSGMKIGSKFLIDGSYLPSNYPETVDFLIKSITHEIKDNKWTTNLESYCIAQGDSSYSTPKRESTVENKKSESSSKSNSNRDKNTNTKNRGDFFSWVRGPYAEPDDNFSNNGYAVAVLKGTVRDKFTQKASTNPPTLKAGYPKTVTSSRGKPIVTEKYTTVDYTSAEFEQQLKDILKGIGAISTPGNIIFMKAWRQAEGGSALNNPWNSTQSIGTKKSNYNYVGVKNYFTYQDGVDATVKTMTNGRYNTVIKALKKGLKDKAEALELARLVQKYDMTGAIPDKWK
jgi:hypothetical protein